MLKKGIISRNSKIRILRDNVVIHTGTINSLKRFKEEVKEVKTGYECGVMIENYSDIKVNDIIETFEIIETIRKLCKIINLLRLSNMSSQRQIRFGEVIRSLISECLLRADFYDNEISMTSITVSFVRMSKDLRIANIYFMPLGGVNKDKLIR